MTRLPDNSRLREEIERKARQGWPDQLKSMNTRIITDKAYAVIFFKEDTFSLSSIFFISLTNVSLTSWKRKTTLDKKCTYHSN